MPVKRLATVKRLRRLTCLKTGKSGLINLSGSSQVNQRRGLLWELEKVWNETGRE
jgi:hypothetical protein